MAKEGILEGITKTEVFGIPVGAAGAGLAAAGVGDMVSGWLSNIVPGVAGTRYGPAMVKGFMAWAANRWGGRIIGSTAANVVALIFTIDAVTDVFDLRGMTAGLISGVPMASGSPARPVETTSSPYSNVIGRAG